MNIQRKPIKPRMRPVNHAQHGRVWVCHGHGVNAIDKTGAGAFGAWKHAAAVDEHYRRFLTGGAR